MLGVAALVLGVAAFRVRALQLAELEAVGLCNLAPAHPARTLLQDAFEGNRLAGLRRDRSAIERGLDLFRRRLLDAVTCKSGLREVERGVDVAVAQLAGGRLEACAFGAGGELHLGVVAQALDESL